jgi:hypothetical protein
MERLSYKGLLLKISIFINDIRGQRVIHVDALSGSMERITFDNLENGDTVLRLPPEHQRGI